MKQSRKVLIVASLLTGALFVFVTRVRNGDGPDGLGPMRPESTVETHSPQPTLVVNDRTVESNATPTKVPRTNRRLTEILVQLWSMPEDADLVPLLPHEDDSAVPEALLAEIARSPTISRRTVQLLRMLRADSPSLAGKESALIDLASQPGSEWMLPDAMDVLVAQDTSAGRDGALQLAKVHLSAVRSNPSGDRLTSTGRVLRALTDGHVEGTTALARELLALAGTPPPEAAPKPESSEQAELGPDENVRRHILQSACSTFARVGDELGVSQLREALENAPTPTERSLVWSSIETSFLPDHENAAFAAAFAPEFERVLTEPIASQNNRAVRAALLWAGLGPGRPDLLLPLEAQISSEPLSVQGLWTESLAKAALRSHDTECIAALARQVRRPEFLQLGFEQHGRTRKAAIQALVESGSPADLKHLASLSTGNSPEVAQAFLECASSEQLQAYPTLLDDILKSLDGGYGIHVNMSRSLALKRLLETRPIDATLGRYENSSDFYEQMDAACVRLSHEFDSKTDAERGDRLLALLQRINTSTKAPLRDAKKLLHDWISAHKFSTDALVATLGSPDIRPETKLGVLLELFNTRDTWSASEACQSLDAVRGAIFGSRLERRHWAMLVAYLVREPSAWGCALSIVKNRRAQPPVLEEALVKPLEELEAALEEATAKKTGQPGLSSPTSSPR